jgi:cell division protein FtsZ
MIEAFATADQVLLAGVQGITDLITTPGLINLDFADVKSVMQGAGSALMGIGSARGADRAIKAAELAVESPLLEASIEGAHGVLLSIQGGSNLGSSRSTTPPIWSRRPRTPRPTSSSERSSTTRSATRCASR